MKIIVHGSELSAWTASACLSQAGNEVIINEHRESNLQPIESISVIRNEPGLTELIEEMLANKRLTRKDQTPNNDAEIHWLAFKPDQRATAESVIQSISQHTSQPILIINQCNFGVGSTDQLQQLISQKRQIHIAYLPEYLQEGKAVETFMHPKHVTIGCSDERGCQLTKAVLRPFGNNSEHYQVTTTKEAELTKLAITGMLALRLGYVNELANLADRFDVDIDVIRQGMGADPRIGNHYLFPGSGFGGQTFCEYLSKFTELTQLKNATSLLKTVVEQNEHQKELLFKKLWRHYECDLSDKKVTLWGTAFKPGTASIDNAPSLKIIEALLAQGSEIAIYDPLALENTRKHFSTHPNSDLLHCCKNPYIALEQSDALLLLTEWPEFWSPDYQKITANMRQAVIFDGRNIFDKTLVADYGIPYYGIGR